jgi:hypothetical protein
VSKAEFLRLSEERYDTFERRRSRAGATSGSQE